MSKFKFSNVEYSQEWKVFEVSDEVKKAKEIEIPKNTTELENYACYGCESVEKLHLPHTISKIGIAAFANCLNLKEINIPSNITELPNDVLYNCTELRELTISPNLKEVAKTALLNCGKLKTIYIACDNFKDYDNYVKNIKNKDINAKCEWKYLYPSKTFFSNFNFTTIPNYDKCAYLVIPRGITKLESCKGASHLKIIEGLENIELNEFVFEDCNSLKEIKLKNVPKGAFKNCKELKHVIISGDVNESAFEGCRELESVEFFEDVKKDDLEQKKDEQKQDSEQKQESEQKNDEQNSEVKDDQKQESEQKQDSEQQKQEYHPKIEKNSFKNCHSLKEIDLSKVDKISESAFENCYSLSNIILPNVSFIPKQCFRACFELNKICMPDSVRKIEESAFENCYKLKEIDLRFTKIIEKNAFKECFHLQELKSDSLKIIDESAFEKCIALKNVDISINKIKLSAFEWCINLESISISNIKQIEPFAFAHCLKLKNATLQGQLSKSQSLTSKRLRIFDDTPELDNIKFISDSVDVENAKELKKGITSDVKLSDELTQTLKEIEDNKKILEKLNETIDYTKYSSNSPRFILDIQRKTINNKLKLIETKNEEMKQLREVKSGSDLTDVHDKVIQIQEKLNGAMKEYESNKNKINELKEEFSDE